ncbi:hypothetical protein S101446_00252 [Komagataeibacter europaeus]|nr:hypothetical protein S101446_00252 [Komagataeibacter europaeus]
MAAAYYIFMQFLCFLFRIFGTQFDNISLTEQSRQFPLFQNGYVSAAGIRHAAGNIMNTVIWRCGRHVSCHDVSCSQDRKIRTALG